MMSRLIFSRNFKRDITLLQYCMAVIIQRNNCNKYTNHVFFFNCVRRSERFWSIGLFFILNRLLCAAPSNTLPSILQWCMVIKTDNATCLCTAFQSSCATPTLTIPLCYNWCYYLIYRFCCSIENKELYSQCRIQCKWHIYIQ